MTITPDDLTAAALRLPPSARAALADRLLASLEEDPEIDATWQAELDRRDQELDRDPSLARPADDVFRRLYARLS